MLDRPFSKIEKIQDYDDLILYAQMCSNIYSNFNPPIGWKALLEREDPSTGLAAACFTHNLLQDDAKVVIVFRGTVIKFPDGIQNILDDISLMQGKMPALVNPAIQFYNDCYNLLKNLYIGCDYKVEDIIIKCTGHSLGAVLADAVSASVVSDKMIFSFTFENPGSLPSIKQIISSMSPDKQKDALGMLNYLCTVTQAGVNLINTCQEQTGTVSRIQNLEYKFFPIKDRDLSVLFPLGDHYFENHAYCIDNTLYQHSIDSIVGYLEKKNLLFRINNPIGQQAGYVEYTDPNNTNLWKGYFDTVWNSDTVLATLLKKQYKYETDFMDDAMQVLRETHARISNPSQKLSNSKFGLFNAQKMIESFTMVNKPIEQPKEEKPTTRCTIM